MRMAKFLLTAGLIWTLYWAVGAWGLRHDIGAWFAEQARQGWLAEYGGMESFGFPLDHGARVLTPVLADPGTGIAWSGAWIHLQRPALVPGTVAIAFPPGSQRLSRFDKTLSLQASDMTVNLDLAPGAALSVTGLTLQSGPWHLSDTDQGGVTGHSLILELLEGNVARRYHITGTASGMHLQGRAWRALTTPDASEDRLIDLVFEADVLFDAAWDRRAIELRRPQPRQIELKLAQIRWGAAAFDATGTIELDESGLPSGQVALTARNWSELLRLAEQAGLLPPSSKAMSERILGLLADINGEGQDLRATLSMTRGQMYLGPLPLGKAPRLLLP